ncbi:MAG: hypothetical protein R3B54_12130 [Bdellovibrionota bacterium]
MIGNGPAWGGSQWVGQIAEVMVFNSALSARAIQHVYRAQRGRYLP